ncbi:MAG: flagellar hook-length control protein FliK [Stellaceae bacterium]
MGSIENGAREVVLRLHPSGLGDLTIRLAVSGREVSAWFATPQTQVQQAISEAIGQLHSTLGNAGYTLAGAWIGNDASNQRAPREQLSAPSPARQAVANAPLELPSTTPISSSSTGVSVYA